MVYVIDYFIAGFLGIIARYISMFIFAFLLGVFYTDSIPADLSRVFIVDIPWVIALVVLIYVMRKRNRDRKEGSEKKKNNITQ